eukprot:Trichotokara_eunicae@DN5903_c0_g1_i4.p2
MTVETREFVMRGVVLLPQCQKHSGTLRALEKIAPHTEVVAQHKKNRPSAPGSLHPLLASRSFHSSCTLSPVEHLTAFVNSQAGTHDNNIVTLFLSFICLLPQSA